MQYTAIIVCATPHFMWTCPKICHVSSFPTLCFRWLCSCEKLNHVPMKCGMKVHSSMYRQEISFFLYRWQVAGWGYHSTGTNSLHLESWHVQDFALGRKLSVNLHQLPTLCHWKVTTLSRQENFHGYAVKKQEDFFLFFCNARKHFILASCILVSFHFIFI